MIVNEKEAEIVRHIFSLAEKGMSSTQIAKELIAKQTPTVTQMRHPERKMERGASYMEQYGSEENPE